MESQSHYFCKICHSNMHSPQMWDSHLRGKRHLKNCKKAPGEAPSKVKQVKRDDIEPLVMEALQDLQDTVIIGLDKIVERHKLDPSIRPMYTCYSCQGTYTYSSVVDHILSSKHQFQFLKEVDPVWHTSVQNMKLKKPFLEPIINEKACEYEREHGRGRVQVTTEIAQKDVPWYWLRRREQDDRDGAAEPLEELYPVWDEIKGIDSLDVKRDVHMLDTNAKLELIQVLIEERIPLRTEEMAQTYMQGINNLLFCKVNNLVRRMTLDQQEKLFEDVMKLESEGDSLDFPEIDPRQ